MANTELGFVAQKKSNVHTAPAVFLLLLWETLVNKIGLTDSGLTGYIDYVKPKDMGVMAVAKGMDENSRKYISFKILAPNWKGVVVESVVTVFQRYSDNEHFWVQAGEQEILFSHDDVQRVDEVKIKALLNGEEVTSIRHKGMAQLQREMKFKLAPGSKL